MDIVEACKTVRECNDAFVMRNVPAISQSALAIATQTVKAYLERARGDGKPIHELEIAGNLLYTPEGMQWAMPFVLSAESILGYERRKHAA